MSVQSTSNPLSLPATGALTILLRTMGLASDVPEIDGERLPARVTFANDFAHEPRRISTDTHVQKIDELLEKKEEELLANRLKKIPAKKVHF